MEKLLIFESQTEKEKIALLRQAINDKVEISFWYKGRKFKDPNEKKYTKQGWRYVQPTDLGLYKGTKNLVLRAWQVSGTTNTQRPEWKTFLVSEMMYVTLMTGDNSAYKPFKTPGGYNFNKYGDKKMVDDKPLLKINLDKEPAPNRSSNLSEGSGFYDWIINIIDYE